MKNETAANVSHLPDESPHFELKHTKVSKVIDNIVSSIGKIASWLWFITMTVILINVVLRYVFASGLVILEELTWYLYGACWLIGLSFAFVSDSHVRVTLFHENFSEKTKLWIDLIGSCVLLLPFLTIVLIDSMPYFTNSFIASETSVAPNGMPVRWLIKFFIPFSFFLLFLVAIARVQQCISSLFLSKHL